MTTSLSKRIRVAAGRLTPRFVSQRARRWLPRRFYVESVITHENAVERLVRRTLRHERPTLYHLDVHVTDHCNLNCRGCEHYSSISDPVFADLGRTTADLERLAELFESIEQIYLLGGEPLLHPEVERFVTETRRIFPRTRLYVMTNGILVSRMPEPFWAALHAGNATLLCDSYPIDLPVDRVNALGQQHGVAIEWMKPVSEFFTIPVDVTGSCDPAASFARCRGLSNCAIVRDGRLYPCAHVAYAHILAKRFGIEGIDATERDSISIWEGGDGDALIGFLTSPVPWCAHCDFGSFATRPWSLGQGEPDEWLRADGPVTRR